MLQEKLTLQKIATDEHVSVGYQDDDIVIIDNVKMLYAPPMAHVDMTLVVMPLEGKVQASVGGHQVELRKGQVAVFPPNMTLSDFMMSPDFDFKAMLVTTSMLQSFLREKMGEWNHLMYVQHQHVIDMQDDDFGFFVHFYEILRLCTARPADTPYKTDVVQALLRAAFLLLCGRISTMSAQTAAPQVEVASGVSLFHRFLQLLSAAEVKRRPVCDYASDLCISAKYLSVVCKRYSGKTANDWITEHVMEDIRYYLRQTELSLKQVSDRLGFPNPSFFCKYVREHFNLTPMQLRRGG